MWKRVLVAVAFVAAGQATASGWIAGPDAEPDSEFDDEPFLWRTAADEAVDRVYFSGHLLFWPVQSAHPLAAGFGPRVASPVIVYAQAYLGYWRDCNGDGVIGQLVSGRQTYIPLAAPLDICPQGSPYYDGFEVKEFRWIGPNAHDPQGLIAGLSGPLGAAGDPRDVEDDGARIWADWGEPGEPWGGLARAFPFPRGTLEDTDGHFAYVDELTMHSLSRHPAAGPLWPTRENGKHNNDSPIPNVGDPVTAALRDRYNDSRDDEPGSALVAPWDWGTRSAPDCELRENPVDWRLDPDGGAYPTLDHLYRSIAKGCSRRTADEIGVFPNLESEFVSTEKVATDWSFFFFAATRFNPSDQGVPPAAQLCLVAERFENVKEMDGCHASWVAREHAVTAQTPYPAGNVGADLVVTFYADTTDVPGMAFPAGVRNAFRYGSEQCGTSDSDTWSCSPQKWNEAMSAPEWEVGVNHPYELRDVDLYPEPLFGSAKAGTRQA